VGNRRTTELLLLMAGAIPVFLLYGLYLAQQGSELTVQAFTVPIGLTVAFAAAHIAVRFLAPGADPAVLPIVFVLSGIGVTFVTRLAPALATGQVMWLFISVAAMVAVLALVRNLESLARYKYTLGAIGLVMLFAPIVLGTEHYGAKLWVEVGSLSFQPGELAKILVVVFLAGFLSENRELLSISNRTVLGVLKVPRLRMLLPLLCMWLISLAIVVWERDLGSAVLFFGIFVVMLFVATGRWFYPIVSAALLAVGAAAAYLCFSHVRRRVDIWLDPFADPTDAGYQIVQGLYSMADGGLFGTGIGQGMPTLIPFVYNDSIFAAIAEEMGLLGASAVLLLFMLFAVRGLLTAARARSDFAAFLAVGLTASVSLQAFVIVGGVTRLIPMTGVTLPFISQGGSSLLASFIAVGLLLRCGDEGTGTQVEMAGSGVRERAVLSAHLETPESGVLGRRALSRRLTVLTCFFTLLFAALIGNLAYIQVIQADEIQGMSSNNHTIARRTYVARGSILTSDGVVLAQSTRQSDGTYVREYPQGAMAAHTVGYVSTQYGSTGIEAAYEAVLSGEAGQGSWEDLLDSVVGTTVGGNDVVLTINSRIQAAAEAALSGRVGAIVVLDTSTGAVLAKASSPTYSNDELETLFTTGGENGPLYDRTVQALYAPGSTFKVITLAAALESGVATLDSTYESPASIDIGGASVTNYQDHDYGTIDLRTAFAVSSNTVFGQVASQVGAQTLVTVANSFGYGRSFGVGFTTAASLMPDPSQMTEWETAWAGAGQPVGEHADGVAGPQTTVMQNAMVAAAIANGGVLMEPYVVYGIADSAGTMISTTAPHALGQACSAAVAQQIGSAMLATVTEGTGAAASIAGVDVAGKTGTAETGGDQPDAWFIGYAPYDDPTVAIAVVIEDDGEHTATTVAGDVLQVAVAVAAGNE
jgi:peptidoglycan glycosyltransferase